MFARWHCFIVAAIASLSVVGCSKAREPYDLILTQPQMIEGEENTWLIQWARFPGEGFETYEIYRSTRSLESVEYVDWKENPIVGYPLARICIQEQSDTSYVDSMVGHFALYYYVVFATTDDSVWQSIMVSVETPDKDLEIPGSQKITLVVEKSKYVLSLYAGSSLLKRYPVALGADPTKRKAKAGDHLTPEGRYHIRRKNPHSKYHKAFVFDYPNTEDAERGLAEGRISKAQYGQIVRSDQQGSYAPSAYQAWSRDAHGSARQRDIQKLDVGMCCHAKRRY